MFRRTRVYTLQNGESDPWLLSEPQSEEDGYLRVFVSLPSGCDPNHFRVVKGVAVTRQADNTPAYTLRQSSLPSLGPNGLPRLERQISDVRGGGFGGPGGADNDGLLVAREINLHKVSRLFATIGSAVLNVPLPKSKDPMAGLDTSLFSENIPHCSLYVNLNSKNDTELTPISFATKMEKSGARYKRVYVLASDTDEELIPRFMKTIWNMEARKLTNENDAIWNIVWETSILLSCARDNGEAPLQPIDTLFSLVECVQSCVVATTATSPMFHARVGIAFAACAGLILRGVSLNETDQTRLLNLDCLNVDVSTMELAKSMVNDPSRREDLAWRHLERLVRDGLSLLVAFDAATFPVASFQSIKCGIWLECLFGIVVEKELGALKRPSTGGSESAKHRFTALEQLRSRFATRVNDEEMFLNTREIADLFRLVEEERTLCSKQLAVCKRKMEHLHVSSPDVDSIDLSNSSFVRAHSQIGRVSNHLKRKSETIGRFFNEFFGRTLLFKENVVEGLEPKSTIPPYINRLVPNRTVSGGISTEDDEQMLNPHANSADGDALQNRHVCFLRCKSNDESGVSGDLLIVRLLSPRYLLVYSARHQLQRIVPLSAIQHSLTMTYRNLEMVAICGSPQDDTNMFVLVRVASGILKKDGKAPPGWFYAIMRLSTYGFDEILLADSKAFKIDTHLLPFVEAGYLGVFKNERTVLLTSKTTLQMCLIQTDTLKITVVNPSGKEGLKDGVSPSVALLDAVPRGLAYSHEEDTIIFAGSKRANEFVLRDISATGVVRTIAKVRATSFIARSQVLGIFPPTQTTAAEEDDPDEGPSSSSALYLLCNEGTQNYFYRYNKIRAGEFAFEERKPAPPLVCSSFVPDKETGIYAGAYAVVPTAVRNNEMAAISLGAAEKRTTATWNFEVTAWAIAKSEFQTAALSILESANKSTSAVLDAENRIIANKILEQTSARYWDVCGRFPAQTLQAFFPVFLLSAPSLKDVSRLHTSVASFLQQFPLKGQGASAFYHEMESSLNVWIDLYNWPEGLYEQDILSLTAMVRTGRNSIVSEQTLSRVLDSRNFVAPVEIGLGLVLAALESFDWDKRDVLRLAAVHWLSRIDVNSSFQRPLPALTILRKSLGYWEDVFARYENQLDPSLRPALEWLCVAHFKTICARRISGLRALVYLDSNDRKSSSTPRRLLFENVAHVFGDVFQGSSTSFSTSLKAVALDTVGGLQCTVWKEEEPSLEFFSRGVLPVTSKANLVNRVLEISFASEWFPQETLVVKDRREEEDSANTKKTSSVLLFGNGMFEAAASGVYIFALTVNPNASKPSYSASNSNTSASNNQQAGMWITVGNSQDRYLRLNQPFTFDLGEGEHEIKIRSFSRIPEVMLVAEGPYTQLSAKHRLEKPLSAKKLPYPIVASLFASVTTSSGSSSSSSQVHEMDSVAGRITWMLLSAYFASREETNKVANAKRKQQEALEQQQQQQGTPSAATEQQVFGSILTPNRQLNSLNKMINELLDFGLDTANVLLCSFGNGTSSDEDDIKASLVVAKDSLGRFLRRVRTNVDVIWACLMEEGGITVTQLERLASFKYDLEKMLPSEEQQQVVKRVDALQTDCLVYFKFLERLSSILSALGEFGSDGAPGSEGLTLDVASRVETLIKGFKKTTIVQLKTFFNTELAPALRKSSTCLSFVESIHTSFFFKPLWRLVVDGSQKHERAEEPCFVGEELGSVLENIQSQWTLFRERILAQSITWTELELGLDMHNYLDERSLRKEVATFFNMSEESDAGVSTMVLYNVEQWSILCLLWEHSERALRCLPYLANLVYQGDLNPDAAKEISDLMTLLERSKDHFANINEETKATLTLDQCAKFASEIRVGEMLSPPVLLRLDESFCETLQQSLPLLLWMRKTRSDAEFASSVEMAFTKPELQVPQELWNHQKNCVDETILGFLSDVRSTLHPLVFNVEDLPISSVKTLFVLLDECTKQSTYSLAEIRTRLSIVNAKRRALMQLLAGDEPTSADSHNQLLFLQSNSAMWTCENGKEACLQYFIPIQSENEVKMVEKRIDREGLADLQSTLVLGAVQSHADDVVADLANTFVEELSIFDAVNECATKLSRAGHLCFQNFAIRVPFGGDTNRLKEAWGDLDALVHEWEDTVAGFRANYPALSCFTNRQIVELVCMLLSSNNLHLPKATDLVKFPVGSKDELDFSLFGERNQISFNEDERAVQLLLCRDPDEPSNNFYFEVWKSCKDSFRECTKEWSNTTFVDPIKALQVSGQALTAVIGNRQIRPRYAPLSSSASFKADSSLITSVAGSSSNQPAASPVRIVRCRNRSRMIDVVLTAYAHMHRFPSRNDCLYCSEFVTADSAMNLVRRWTMNEDENSLFCLIGANALSFDHQRQVGKALENVVASSTTKKCPFLIVLASHDPDVIEESAIEIMFASTGRIALTPLPVSDLRSFVKASMAQRGVDAQCFFSKLPGQGKSYQIKKRAHPQPVHDLRLNAILDITFLISITRTTKRCVHIDISDSAARSDALGAVLFDYVILNGLIDETSGESCTWQSSPSNRMSIFVEIPSKAPPTELRVCHLLDPILVEPGPQGLEIDFDMLKVGMGPEDFFSLRFDGTCDSRLSSSSVA